MPSAIQRGYPLAYFSGFGGFAMKRYQEIDRITACSISPPVLQEDSRDGDPYADLPADKISGS